MRKNVIVIGAVITVIGFIIMLVGGFLFALNTDYSEDEKENPGMWALVIGTLIGCILFPIGILAVIIGFILRKKKPQPQSLKYCSNCGQAAPFDARICPYCGKNFEQYYIQPKRPKYCKECGSEINQNDKFCIECGNKL